MKAKILPILLIITTFCLVEVSQAQFNTPSSGASFSLNFQGAMPMGDFAATSTPGLISAISGPSVLSFDDNSCNADMGAGFGFKVDYRFDFGMGIFISVDAVWNQLNKDIRTKYDNVSKTKPNYVNFPIMLGLDYKCFFGNVFGLYAEGGAGLGILYITPEGWSDDMTHFELSNAFAWQAGAGILLGEHISLGVHYNMFGEHKLEIKDPTVLQSFIPEQKKKMSTLEFRLGVIF